MLLLLSRALLCALLHRIVKNVSFRRRISVCLSLFLFLSLSLLPNGLCKDLIKSADRRRAHFIKRAASRGSRRDAIVAPAGRGRANSSCLSYFDSFMSHCFSYFCLDCIQVRFVRINNPRNAIVSSCGLAAIAHDWLDLSVCINPQTQFAAQAPCNSLIP